MEFIFWKVCYDVLTGAVPDGETQDAQGYPVFPAAFRREIAKSHLFADVAVLAGRFRMEIFLFWLAPCKIPCHPEVKSILIGEVCAKKPLHLCVRCADDKKGTVFNGM